MPTELLMPGVLLHLHGGGDNLGAARIGIGAGEKGRPKAAGKSVICSTPVVPLPLEMMPESVSTVPLLSTAPPAVLILKLLLNVRLLDPSAWNVPPLSVTSPTPTELLVPGVLLVTCSVPALMMVPPE